MTNFLKKTFQLAYIYLQAYPRADTLKRHILSFHEGKKMYKCDVCNKSFKGHIKVSSKFKNKDTFLTKTWMSIFKLGSYEDPCH